MFDDEDIEDYLDEEQDRKAAIKRYEDMLKTHDSIYFDSAEFEYIIDNYVEKNQLRRSREAVDLAMQQHPESSMLKIKEARQYLLENQPEKAFDILQHVEHDEEETPDYFLVLGSCLAALGQSQEALDNYFNALPYFDEDEKFDLYNAIAYEYQRLHNFKCALEFYEKALPLVNDYLNERDTIYHEIRACYLSEGRKEDAIAFFQRLVDENPHNSKAWTNIGDCYRMMGEYEESIDPYEYALAIDPEDLWTNMHLADIYYDLGRYQEAIDTLEEALRNGVETSIIHTSLGDCYYRLNNLDSAKQHFQKAVEMNEMNGGGWAGLGYISSDCGDSKQAIKYFERAFELEPWETEHLYSIAADYHKLNRLDLSMDYLRKIQEMNPRDPDSYYYIADLYGEMDQVDEAINTLQYGLQQTDNAPILLYLLAYAYFLKGQRTEGLDTLDCALDADFESYIDFLEYDRDLLANDTEIIELIAQHKQNQETTNTSNE